MGIGDKSNHLCGCFLHQKGEFIDLQVCGHPFLRQLLVELYTAPMMVACVLRLWPIWRNDGKVILGFSWWSRFGK